MATEFERDERQGGSAADRQPSDPKREVEEPGEQHAAGALTGRHARHPWSHRLADAGTETGNR